MLRVSGVLLWKVVEADGVLICLWYLTPCINLGLRTAVRIAATRFVTPPPMRSGTLRLTAAPPLNAFTPRSNGLCDVAVCLNVELILD